MTQPPAEFLPKRLGRYSVGVPNRVLIDRFFVCAFAVVLSAHEQPDPAKKNETQDTQHNGTGWALVPPVLIHNIDQVTKEGSQFPGQDGRSHQQNDANDSIPSDLHLRSPLAKCFVFLFSLSTSAEENKGKQFMSSFWI
jgi:hypothetical protein